MEIIDVRSDEFREYGEVLEGIDVSELLQVLDTESPCPDDGTVYVPSVPELEKLSVYSVISDHVYGGMPVEIGYCNGTNYKLNCLEWHRGSEVNVSSSSFVLLLAKIDEIIGGKLDTANVKAFRVPAGVPVLVYETTLHYAPCGHFRVIVALPKGTNTYKPVIENKIPEDQYLWARNKWLIAHPDTAEAKQGAYVGLSGENIDISDDFKA